ncbi:MAG: hypothetical protein H0W88_06290 [Parachlamydiaceae bacterium]|nr:hypothetical protein [Parachlamydiaceae bacterium]
MKLAKLFIWMFILSQSIQASEEIHGFEEISEPYAILKTSEIMNHPQEKRITNLINSRPEADVHEQISLANIVKSNAVAKHFPKPVFPISVKLKPNFTAIEFPEGFLRPDQSGSVGPKQYIALCIGRIRSFDKKGHPDGVLDVTTEQFFASVLPPEWGVNFPQIQYDANSGRWFLVAVNGFGFNPNQIILAVSNEAVITKHTQWSFYAFPKNPKEYRQLPNFGISPAALFIGSQAVTEFEPKVKRNPEGFVVNMKGLLGNKLKVTHFDNLATILGGPLFPSGVTIFDDRKDVGYFIGANTSDRFNQLAIRVINNPGTNPTLSPKVNLIDISLVLSPIPVPQKGSNVKLTPRGFLPTSSHQRNGFIYYTQTTLVDSNGVAVFSENARDGIRWYKINAKKSSNIKLADEGTLFSSEPDVSKARFFWLPSIMTNKNGTMFLGANTAGANYFPNASISVRLDKDEPGTLSELKLITHSKTPYNFEFWTEYTNLSIDPCDNRSVWSIQQFSVPVNQNNQKANWGLQVCRIRPGVKLHRDKHRKCSSAIVEIAKTE